MNPKITPAAVAWIRWRIEDGQGTYRAIRQLNACRAGWADVGGDSTSDIRRDRRRSHWLRSDHDQMPTHSFIYRGPQVSPAKGGFPWVGHPKPFSISWKSTRSTAMKSGRSTDQPGL